MEARVVCPFECESGPLINLAVGTLPRFAKLKLVKFLNFYRVFENFLKPAHNVLAFLCIAYYFANAAKPFHLFASLRLLFLCPLGNSAIRRFLLQFHLLLPSFASVVSS